MNKISFYIVLTGLLSLISCRELYYPETDSMDNVLIVEGLVTNKPGMSRIRLLAAGEPVPERNLPIYGIEDPNLHPVDNAVLYIEDDQGEIIPFRHVYFGEYLPVHPSFSGVPERTYTLHIETADESVYRSDPQSMPLPAIIDSVYPKKAEKDYLVTNHNGNITRLRSYGVEAYADLRSQSGDILRFRTEPTLLLLYKHLEFLSMGRVNVYYHWKKIKRTDAAGINLHRFDHGIDNVKNHLLTFMSSNKHDYQISTEEIIDSWIIILEYYTLNEETYDFHHQAYKQGNSENKIFDPIASQLPSNIKCITHPDKPVVGFFEASSVGSETHLLVDKLHDNIFSFIKTSDMEYVPVMGTTMNLKPEFWPD